MGRKANSLRTVPEFSRRRVPGLGLESEEVAEGGSSHCRVETWKPRSFPVRGGKDAYRRNDLAFALVRDLTQGCGKRVSRQRREGERKAGGTGQDAFLVSGKF